MRRLKNWIPPLVSFALIGWVLSLVSLADLAEAARQLNWEVLVPATAAMVVALYLWDGLILQTLFGTDERPIPYRKALHMRGCSYLVTAVHYPLGQAALAWAMARLQKTSLVNALSRSALLCYFDAVILLSMGLFGALMSDNPRIEGLPLFCSVGLAIVIGLGLMPLFLSPSQRERLKETRWGVCLENWNWSRTIRVVLLRAFYFFILIAYGAAALWISGIDLETMVVVSSIPLVLLADGLPSISGLGTRETAFMLLIQPDRPEVLLAVCLFWSMGLVVVRVVLGLGHLWIPRLLAVGDHSEGIPLLPPANLDDAAEREPAPGVALEESIEPCYETPDA